MKTFIYVIHIIPKYFFLSDMQPFPRYIKILNLSFLSNLSECIIMPRWILSKFMPELYD